MRKIISLNGVWKLKGTAAYVPLRDKSMETGKPLEGITQWIDACVPGGVTRALYNAGYIEHPYVDMNSLKCEWIENRWWIYRREFDRTPMDGKKRIFLQFDGVDYACMVYLNGVLLGSHEGMFEDFRFDITEQYQANEHFILDVLILHAPDEMGQIGFTSKTSTQKSRFNYKWDFSTRLVNLGIWQSVCLIGDEEAAISDLFVTSDVLPGGEGLLSVRFEAARHESCVLSAKVACSFDGTLAAEQSMKADEDQFSAEVTIPDPQLWYPNGIGPQPLYDVTVTLYGGGQILDERKLKQGIRHFEMVQNEGAPQGALPYTAVVNGVRVYMKGVNVTPMDHIYGDVTREQVEFQLGQAAALNANIVRVWGGGLIETEQFYDCCDRLGLMVWQEFIQSSSGVDNIPSEEPGFLELLKKAATHALKIKRNHTSLVIWSGGNELMDGQKKPMTLKNKNLSMLAELAHTLDPDRCFLPTSPSGPQAHISQTPNFSHDVHGWWQYQGNPIQYSYFGDTDSLLHSEFGCDGMSCMQTVCRQLSVRPARPERMHDNDLWRFHGDWWCTYDREERMFGHVENLELYIRLSQWMQAEGLRFILEANQRRKWRNSGSIIWQLSEPWPNLSCTAIVDYYGHAKQAYFWAKKAFSPLHVSLNYRRLDYAPGTRFCEDVVIFTDHRRAGEALVTARVMDLSGNCYAQMKETTALEANKANDVGKLAFTMPDPADGLVLVRLIAELNGEKSFNEYWFATHAVRPYQAAAALHGGRLEAALKDAGSNGGVLCMRNTGDKAILHACVEDASGEWNLMPEENFITLLPGESAQVRIRWSRRFRVGFDTFEPFTTSLPALAVLGIGLDSGCRVEE